MRVTAPKDKAAGVTCPCGNAFTLPLDTIWHFSFRDPQGRSRSVRVGPSRQAAQAAERKTLTAIAENRWLDKRAVSRITLGECLRLYEDQVGPQVKPKVLYDRMRCLRQAADHLGGSGVELGALTERTFEDYRAERLREGWRLGSINTVLARTRAFLSWAVRMGYLDKRPRISTPQVENGRLRYLTREEADRLLEAAAKVHLVGPVLRDYLELLLFTGMRRTEGLTLSWFWLDLGHRVINLPSEYSKNGHARVIPLAVEVVSMLERRRGLAVPGVPFVFTTADGKPLTDGRAEWGFWKARNAAGLGKDVTLHTLRHTCASWLTMAGVDLLTTASVLGHRDLAMTRRYSHLSPGHLLNAVDRISRMETAPAPTLAPDGEEESTKDGYQAVTRPENVILFPTKTGS